MSHDTQNSKFKSSEVKSHICHIPNYNFDIEQFILSFLVSGHSGPVLCLAITKQSQYLLTGSDDISIIVWDLKSLNLKLRI
jgi:WD40 repeat protein